MRRALFYSLCFLKCSTSCGPGVMTRKVECQLTQADGSTTVIPSIACAYRLNKPLSEITCHENITCNNEGEKDITYWLTIYVYRPGAQNSLSSCLVRVKKGNIRQGKNAFHTLNIDLKMMRTLSSPQKNEVRDSPPLKV